ncbi:hypothetical protein H0H93_014996, partial [Arthromyces matolae]
MFARLSAIVLLALPLFAMAQETCSTEGQQCCNSLQSAQSDAVASVVPEDLLDIILQDVDVLVG